MLRYLRSPPNMKITRIYTRRGDSGNTDLVGGVRISKADVRIEAYGTVDELSVHLGLLAALMAERSADSATMETLRSEIISIQNTLFNVCTHLATDQSQTELYPSAHLPEGATERLEKAIDSMKEQLPEPQGFILPGGTVVAAQAHVCRTVCRRAERCIATLAQTAIVGAEIMTYINRLSDFLFALTKIINFNSGQNEILWKNA